MPELKNKLRCGACGSELKRTHEHEKNGLGLSCQYGACPYYQNSHFGLRSHPIVWGNKSND